MAPVIFSPPWSDPVRMLALLSVIYGRGVSSRDRVCSICRAMMIDRTCRVDRAPPVNGVGCCAARGSDVDDPVSVDDALGSVIGVGIAEAIYGVEFWN